MNDETKRRLLDSIRNANTTISRAVAERDRLIREAATAQIAQAEIMEAASLKRTRLHEIIHKK